MIPQSVLRQFALESLMEKSEIHFNSLVENVANLALAKGIGGQAARGFGMEHEPAQLNNDDFIILNQIIWDFISERVVTPGKDSSNPNWPWFRLTEFGREVARETSFPYYDPEGYLVRLNEVAPGVDTVVVQYLTEALNCFRQRLFFSAAVMCGAASEKAVLMLLNAMAGYEQSDKKKKDMLALLERPSLPRIFETIQSTLDALVEKKGIPYSVHEGSTEHLLSLFEMIRVHRNEAVHPKAGTVNREKVFLALQSMPVALAVTFRLTTWFQLSGGES